MTDALGTPVSSQDPVVQSAAGHLQAGLGMFSSGFGMAFEILNKLAEQAP
ncbi:MAG TPA: hypothetical protein VFH58_08750 [Acidimicrobiales bacterium]|nr:hypothetical protein [Acidimicrobiales bacterium]